MKILCGEENFCETFLVMGGGFSLSRKGTELSDLAVLILITGVTCLEKKSIDLFLSKDFLAHALQFLYLELKAGVFEVN